MLEYLGRLNPRRYLHTSIGGYSKQQMEHEPKGGPLDTLGRANPRRYLPVSLYGHTLAQMREEHHVDEYSAAQHAAAIANSKDVSIAFGNSRTKAPDDTADPATAYARQKAGYTGFLPGANKNDPMHERELGFTRHHKIPSDQLRAAWGNARSTNKTVQSQRRTAVRSSLQAMLEGGDALRQAHKTSPLAAPDQQFVKTRTKQLEALAQLDPRQAYEWHPDNFTLGRAPSRRTVALSGYQDPGNAFDPAHFPQGHNAGPMTPRSKRMSDTLKGSRPTAAPPTRAQVPQLYEQIAKEKLDKTKTISPTRFTHPALTHTHK